MGYRLPLLTAAAAALLGTAPMSHADAFNPFAPRKIGPTVLAADEAFRPLPPVLKGDQLKLEWDIAPGYYLYRSRIAVSVLDPADGHLGALSMPKGQPHHDEHLGDDEICRNDLTATAASAAGIKRVKLRYQGCADAGLCYPPQEKEFDVTTDGTP